MGSNNVTDIDETQEVVRRNTLTLEVAEGEVDDGRMEEGRMNMTVLPALR